MILLIAHISVAVTKVIILGVMFGFGDLIQCLMLYCAYSQHNFCNAFIYMIGCLFLALQIAMPAGLAIQTGQSLSSAFSSLLKGVNSTFTLVYMLLVLLFYVVAITLAFRAYREFKYSAQIDSSARGQISR